MAFSIYSEGKHLISIDAQGILEQEDISRGAAQLLEITQGIEEVNILVRMQSIDLPSLHAVANKWSRKPEFLALQNRAARVAVLTDQAWIRQSATMQAGALPQTDLKVFDLTEEVDARVWLEPAGESVPA